MTLPHWVGYRTEALADGDLLLVGRAFHGYPVAVILALVGFGLPTVLLDPGAIPNARPSDVAMFIFLLLSVVTAGLVYLLWFFSVERTIRFTPGGDLTIADRMVLRSTSRQLNLRDIRRFRVSTSYPHKSFFKLTYITADLANGETQPIGSGDAQMYSWQGRQARDAIERFLVLHEMKIPVEGA